MSINEGNHKIILRREKLNLLSKEELIKLSLLARLNNVVFTWLYIRYSQPETGKSNKNLIRNYEINSICAGIIYEAYNTIFRDDGLMVGTWEKLEPINKEKYQTLKEKFSERKSSKLWNVLDLIRNKHAFHFDKRIFDPYFLDGEATEDINFGKFRTHIENGEENITDVLFTLPWEYQIDAIIKIQPDSVSPENTFVWLFKEVNREMRELLYFLTFSIFDLYKDFIEIEDTQEDF